MKVSRISLQNTGIIRSLEIPCSGASVIEISGANASGKTTIINAINALIEGGAHPELIGPAADEYSVEVHLDAGVRFLRREWFDNAKDEHRYEVKGWYTDGSVVKNAPTYLKKLISGLSLNPTGLVDAPAKDRVKFFQSAIGARLSFTAQEIAEATGDHPANLPRTMDVERFNAYRDGRYERRREVNVALKNQEATRKEWAKALPDDDPLRASNAESAVEAYQSTAAADVHLLVANLQGAREALAEAQNEWRTSLHALKDELSETEHKEIVEIQREAERKIEAVRIAKQKDREALQATYDEAVADGRKPFDAEIERLAGELAAAQQRLADEQRQQGIRDSIIKLDREIREKQDEANRLDDAVKALDALKREKLDALPIPGVEVRDGEIFYDGLSFERQLNTATKYLLSFQVAALTLGDLPFMIFDGAEALDAENKAAFIEGMKDAGFQVVMATVVDDGPLTVQVA